MLFIFNIYINYTVNNMRRITELINEKLKVSKNSVITLESLLKVLKDYYNRNNSKNNYFSLWGIFKEYPTVLHYDGTYTDKNIIGNEILGLRCNNDEVFIYFNEFVGDSVKIENTEELYDIFGEEVLNKIYDYIVNH